MYAHDEQLAELVCAVGCVRATLANALIDARDWADAADAASRAGTSEGTGSKGKGKKKRDKPRDDDLRDARRSRERDMLDRVVSDASERPEMSKELRSSMKLEHTAREWARRVREQARAVADFAKEFAKTCETLNADCENTFAISLEASLREHEETWIAHDVAKKRFEKLSAVREKSKSTDTVERRADLDEASTRLSSLVAQMNALEELIKLRSMNFTVYFRPQIVHLMRLYAVNQCQKFEEANAVVAATLAETRRLERAREAAARVASEASGGIISAEKRETTNRFRRGASQSQGLAPAQFELSPAHVHFGRVLPGVAVKRRATLTNVSSDLGRFAVRQPSGSVFAVEHKPGMVSPGLAAQLKVVCRASRPGEYVGEATILTESQVFVLSLSAVVAGAGDAENVPNDGDAERETRYR